MLDWRVNYKNLVSGHSRGWGQKEQCRLIRYSPVIAVRTGDKRNSVGDYLRDWRVIYPVAEYTIQSTQYYFGLQSLPSDITFSWLFLKPLLLQNFFGSWTVEFFEILLVLILLWLSVKWMNRYTSAYTHFWSYHLCIS